MVVRLRLSGPVEVVLRGRPVDVGPPQRRAVLAALAVDAGRPVPVEVLIERVWGADPPEGARRALYAHICRIRRLGQEPGTGGRGRLPVLRRCGGYQLDLDPDAVDLRKFLRLVALARVSGQSQDRRAALLRESLALWRGEPLAGLRGGWSSRVREAWRRRRVDAAVRLADIEVHGGDPAAVAHQLRDLLDEHPTTEPVAEALMYALYVAGDGAEALRCYAQLRHRLVEELGAEPGHGLRELHRRILLGRPPGGAADLSSAPAAPDTDARTGPAGQFLLAD
ncbi:AfsR/SARP family transcriptional regulator [Streptomyces chrestomyceticus]|uniref:AfsR/SARP family transcriptional regulator n=1 Tax=Streptomyces chrestomyceticus TaxID=68185 RepID=UPI0023B0D962|nr:AfsR/SARP family transcriptional regulator [Streptomyces chrestomyceticus]